MEGEKYLFVVSGPSGVGKDNQIARLRGPHPQIENKVSPPTPPPPAGTF